MFLSHCMQCNAVAVLSMCLSVFISSLCLSFSLSCSYWFARVCVCPDHFYAACLFLHFGVYPCLSAAATVSCLLAASLPLSRSTFSSQSSSLPVVCLCLCASTSTHLSACRSSAMSATCIFSLLCSLLVCVYVHLSINIFIFIHHACMRTCLGYCVCVTVCHTHTLSLSLPASLHLSRSLLAVCLCLCAFGYFLSYSLPTTISSLPPLVALVCMSHLCKHKFIHILLLCLFSVCHIHTLTLSLSFATARLHLSRSACCVFVHFSLSIYISPCICIYV